MRNTSRKVIDEPVLNRILATMQEKGVNQQDVARYLGLGNETFTRWKYENGKSSITEYNEARTRLAKARSDKAQAACEYLFQSRLLDFYRGGALEL